MRRCIIHAGTHKTGTKSIQLTLARHSAILSRAGYLFPQTGRSNPLTGHHNIAFGLHNFDRVDPGLGTTDELLEEIAASDLDVILSSEEFVYALYCNPENFRDFVDRVAALCPRVSILLYLRKQQDLIRSNYFERLKYGATFTFEDYLRQRLAGFNEFELNYSKLLSAANSVSGAELTVRSYDAVSQGKVVADFFKVLRIPSREMRLDVCVNVEAPLGETFLTYYQNRMGRPATEAELQIIAMILESFPDAKLRMADATLAAVVQKFKRSNNAVAAEWGLHQLTAKTLPAAENSIVIDHIFSDEFPLTVHGLGAYWELFNKTQAALEETQNLAIDRFNENEALSRKLDRCEAALMEAQNLAIERFDEIEEVSRRLDRTEAALAETQNLAVARFHEIEELSQKLDRTEAALAEAQNLAAERFQGIAELSQRLNQIRAVLDKT